MRLVVLGQERVAYGRSGNGAPIFLGTELKMENKRARRAPKNRKKLIRSILDKIEKEFKDENKETKATLADFIRLTQLERELEAEEQPGEIIITWAEPSEKQSVGR